MKKSSVKKNNNWQDQLKDVMKDADHFGHNVDVDIKKYLKKIEKLCNNKSCAFRYEINIIDDCTVKINRMVQISSGE